MKRVIFVLGLFLFCCTTSTTYPQREIHGVVLYDGKPLPGVTINLRSPHGTDARVTGVDGRFVFGNLAPGVYSVEAMLPGFDGVQARVDMARYRGHDIQLSMRPASAAEAITVTAEAPAGVTVNRMAMPAPPPPRQVVRFRQNGAGEAETG